MRLNNNEELTSLTESISNVLEVRTTAVRVTVKNARMGEKIVRWINTNMGQTMDIDDIDTDGIASSGGFNNKGDIIIDGDDASKLAQMVTKQFKRDVVIKRIG